MGTRSQTVIGEDVKLGLRHFYSGILSDIFNLIRVDIYNPAGTIIHTIPGGSVSRVGLGVYEVTAPGSLFTTEGTYYDVWVLVPVDGASTRQLSFHINVVTSAEEIETDIISHLELTLSDLTPCFLKKYYLWPVWGVLSNGYYLQDSVLLNHIDSATSWMQRQLNMPLRGVRVMTSPYPASNPNPVKGVDYDEDGRLFQWSAVGSPQWSTIKLPQNNVYKINGLRGVYGGKTVYTIPNDWVIGNEAGTSGVVRVRPTTSGAINSLIDNSGQFLDVTLLEAMGHNFVPGFWAVDYEYGFKGDKFAREIGDVIMKKASVLLLDQLGQQISRGLSSRSAGVDGLNSSLSFVANAEKTIFGALATRYEQDLIPDNLIDMKRKYKGINVFIL